MMTTPTVFGAQSYVAPPPPPSMLPQQPQTLPIARFQVVIDWGKLQFLELVGQGTFGYVYKALYDRTPVAVKRLQCQANDHELISLFQHELSVVTYVVMRL